MSCDALRRGRHSLHHQVYCITTVTRGRHPSFTDITAARLLVRELRRLHEQGDVISLAWFGIFAITPIGTASGWQMTMKHRCSNEFDPTGLIGRHG